MRFNEFEKDAHKQLAERRDLSEEQLDEILPAIAGMAARAVGGAAIRGAAKGAAALGRAGARAVGSAAKGAVKGAGSMARTAAQSAAKSIAGRGEEEPETNDPNATVGSQKKVPMGSQGSQGTTSNNIKPGKSLKLPSQTATGKPGPSKPFKVTRVKGDEVEIENPLPKPGEPKKFVYNKTDLEGNIE